MSKLLRILVAVAAGLSPLGAQRPPVRPTPTRPPAAVPPTDSAGAKKPPANYALNFQDQDIRVVLSAIAEAGGLNLTLANLPQRNVTLRMGQPASRDEMVTIIRGIAESNGLKVSEAGVLIRIEGDIPPTAAQAARQQQLAFQAPVLRLYTYRLKHASAVQLAPVLMSLLSGAAGTTGVNNGTIFTAPNGGFQV
ncbi:MAG: hypothetical protein ACHQQR_08675, partial [Gemmatimonadales bacterium]